MAPVEPMFNPLGKPVAPQVYEPEPPVAEKETPEGYTSPTAPVGGLDGDVTTNGGLTVSEYVWLAVPPPASVTVSVTLLKVPLAVGVPEMTPALLMPIPPGNPLPVQVLLPEPPLAVAVKAV
jgi:hypothetical protein